MKRRMKQALLGLIAFFGLIFLTMWVGSKNIPIPSGEVISSLVLTHANIVDVQTGQILADRNIFIEDETIVSISRSDDAALPENIRVIDVDGSYVIPGLWDMHAHVTPYTSEYTTMPAMVANGVFHVREMIGDCIGGGCTFYRDVDTVRALQKSVASGEVLGPQIQSIGSFPIAGPRGNQVLEETFFEPATAEDARALALYLKYNGTDFIKLYNSIPRAAYFALLEEAKILGLPAAGHIPKSISLEEAIHAGQQTIDHARYPILGCSKMSESYHKAYAHYASHTDAAKVQLVDRYRSLLDTIDEQACDQLLDLWAASGSYYVPTHLTRRAETMVHKRSFLTDPRAQYVSQLVLKIGWEEAAADYEGLFAENENSEKDHIEFYQKGVELTGRAHRAGVKVMVGTDVGDMMIYPGFAVHDEMAILVEAGLSPLDSLRAATLVPAEFYGIQQMYGSVAVGRQAEFVILNANPLIDIENIKSIRSLYYGGRFYDRKSLDDVLRQVRDNASGLGLFLTSGWAIVTRLAPDMFF